MLEQSLDTRQCLRCPAEAAAGRRQPLLTVALAAGLLLSVGLRAEARENQLAGIRLGRPADTITDLFGNPTRTITGGGGGAAAAGGPGMMGGAMGPGAGPGMMGGAMGPGAGPGMMGGGPGMMGGGMMGGGAAPALTQKYEGKIAGMQPEAFVARVTTPEATGPVLSGEAAAALGPGAGGGPGMMGPGMMGGGPGMMGPGMRPGGGMMGGAGPQAQAAVPAITWVYERASQGVTYAFGFSEDGRITLVSIGDDKPYSTCKGGKQPPFAGAKTSKGIRLGSTFKSVILAYGFPEQTEILGDEVLCKYFDRHGVAFTFRQEFMRVSSITIRSPEE
ncbi:MAG: hypothetical protein GX774_08925 [Armatimonadetes bacterium]|nr:hypothetical protein [Armatimonadota bacterium]